LSYEVGVAPEPQHNQTLPGSAESIHRQLNSHIVVEWLGRIAGDAHDVSRGVLEPQRIAVSANAAPTVAQPEAATASAISEIVVEYELR